MKFARFQRIEIPTDTDEWEGQKRMAIRNSDFLRRSPHTSKWMQAIQMDHEELVIDFERSPRRVVLNRIAIVKGGVDNEPDA